MAAVSAVEKIALVLAFTVDADAVLGAFGIDFALIFYAGSIFAGVAIFTFFHQSARIEAFALRTRFEQIRQFYRSWKRDRYWFLLRRSNGLCNIGI